MAALVDAAVRYFTKGNAPSDFSLGTFLRALTKTPSLARELYAALGNDALYMRRDLLFIIREAGDPAGIELLAGLQAIAGWSDAVLALDAAELTDALIAKLPRYDIASEPHLPVIAAYYGGARARGALGAIVDRAEDQVALAIALVGDPADLAWFKALSTRGLGVSAKRVHGAFAKPKLADRLAALDAIPKDIGHLGTLLALCKLLADPEPPIVERAARHLRDYIVDAPYRNTDLFATFLRRARAAIAEGITPDTRAALEDINAIVPNSPPLPVGPPPKKAAQVIASRAAVAEQKLLGAKARGLEMLETLRDHVPAKPATARNAGLEAQITEAPDDAARYLVYADWLQTQNDPRGLLITLQHAAQEAPGDKAREIAAKAFLHEHRHVLLGPLEPFVRERAVVTLELAWFRGFIQSAVIRGARPKLVEEALAALLATPSGSFLQELVVEAQGGPLPIDPKRIVDMLLEAKEPQTLARITIGKPGTWTMPSALKAAFPRLQRDPSEVWAEAMARAAEQKKLKIDLDIAQVPTLVPRVTGITVDMQSVLLGLKAELDKQRPLGVLAAMPNTFERDSLDGFALALAQQWEQRETQRWLFDTLGPLGGERCVQFISQRLDSWSHARAVQGIDHLVRIGSDDAIYAIVTLALGNRSLGARRHAAYAALDIVAKQRDLADRDALLVAVYPKRGSAKVAQTQRRWLEYLMLSGSRMPAAAFRRHVAGNPLRVPLAETLVWAECAGPRVLRTFRLGDGFEPQQDVGLVHPAELAPEEVDRLRRARAGTSQAILQLERPVYWLSPAEARTKALARFAKRRVGFYALQSVLEQRGWSDANADDMHGTSGWTKHFPRDHAEAEATLNETQGSIAKVEVRDHRGARVLDSLHVVTLSELLWDLETAHGRALETAAAPSKAPPIVIERAKSGRSKCVVCSSPIAKDALRLGIERTIETPAFTGLATVWIHPDCAAKAPELAGIDLAALLQGA